MDYTIRYHDRIECTDIERTFWIPDRGGYIRERISGRQVCERLNTMGNTLTATPESFVGIIQRERRRQRDRALRDEYACRCVLA